MKGKICLKLERNQEAIIYFNQSLQIQSNQNYVKLSLANLIIYFLKQRDFYEATTYCKRSEHLLVQKSELIENLSSLAQGLILLMKRNFSEGLNTLDLLMMNSLQEIPEREDEIFIKNLYFNAEAYAYFSLGKHE